VSCRDCRWWSGPLKVPTTRGAEIQIQGLCGGIGSEWDWRLEDGEPVDDLAVMVDANAQLVTHADFGCHLWRPNAESERFWKGLHLEPEHDPMVCSECAKRGTA
jgi:hypothetical protein